jgi:hypothetical protein
MTMTAEEQEIEEALGGNVPRIDFTDPAMLETMYGNYSFFDHYRTAVLAQCTELVRADFNLRGEKITEDRLKNIGRTHPIYLDFLGTHFRGRHEREKNVWESLRSGG